MVELTLSDVKGLLNKDVNTKATSATESLFLCSYFRDYGIILVEYFSIITLIKTNYNERI